MADHSPTPDMARDLARAHAAVKFTTCTLRGMCSTDVDYAHWKERVCLARARYARLAKQLPDLDDIGWD